MTDNGAVAVLPPLEDPTYEPIHRPFRGGVHPVVAKWGPRSQLRWFTRFWSELRPMRKAEADLYYCHSVEHRGWCCESCIGDAEDGYPTYDDPARAEPLHGEWTQVPGQPTISVRHLVLTR